MSGVVIHSEVQKALISNQPVVALESAVITSGLPREPYKLSDALRTLAPQWRDGQPMNLELGLSMSEAIRERGAVPALIGVIDGTLHIGMDDRMLRRLAKDPRAEKTTSADMAWKMNAGKSAGTTVSATLAACGLARSAGTSDRRIRVFATGGIGGVHRGWVKHPDISADLRAIASTPVCVASAGAKSILDLPATLEALQMLGVPVVGYQTNWFPQFHATGEPASNGVATSRADCLRISHRVDDADAAARVCRDHWETLRQHTGILLCNPVPSDFSLDGLEIELAVTEAERQAEHRQVTGAGRTPFLLAEIARLTEGRSLRANVALLLNNAALAAQVAAEMTR